MAAPRIDRRLAAILAADVVGYSRLMQRDEQGTLDRVRTHRKEFIEPLIAEHKGRIVKLMGDGLLVEFGSAVDAVCCAVLIQQGMAEREAGVAEADKIRLRIGINLGDVIHEEGDVYGDGVNIAARLEGLAEPGGICIARNIHNQVKGKLAFRFAPMGPQRVKNIAEPVEVWRVLPDGTAARATAVRRRLTFKPALAAALALLLLIGAGAGGWWWYESQVDDLALPAKSSIAVLPFDNMGGDEATGRLADGITEDVITDLARFRDLDVIARNSTAVYKGKPVDVRQIGRELNVDYVLEGSIQRQGDRIRATAQLINAESGAHVWSERWDRPVQDVFAVQGELAERVASKLGGYSGVILRADQDTAKRKRPGDLNAYELYLLGIEAKHRQTEESVKEAIHLLQRAVETDPTLARAWSGLSYAYGQLMGWVDPTPELQRARLDAARRAVELDPMDAEAHTALGDALGNLGDFARAEAEFDKALSLNPNSADILTLYAGWASAFGKPEKGVEAAEQAIRLNPAYPPWVAGNYRYAYFMAGRYEEALRILERKPKETYRRSDFVFRAASLAALGRTEEARTAVAETLARYPNLTIEGYLDPQWSEAERPRLMETMHAAGFPLCATAEDLKLAGAEHRHLPECEAERTKAAAVRS